MEDTPCPTGASGGGRPRLHSHLEIPTTDPLSEVFCQGLLYVFLGDWFVCTCMCQGGHIHLSYIYTETKRGHQVLLYHSLTPFRQSFPVNLLELAIQLGLACQQTHAPPASSTPEPRARVTGTGIHSQSLCGCFRGSSGVCSYPLSHLSFPVSDFLSVPLQSEEQQECDKSEKI